MRIEAKSLSAIKKKEKVRALYRRVPLTESTIELDIDDQVLYNWDEPIFSNSLLKEHIAYIPRHITEVALSGNYIEDVMDISDSDDPMPIFEKISIISKVFRECVYYLPSSVHSLSLNFSYVPPNTNPVHINELIGIVKDLPTNIKTLNLSGTDLFKSQDRDLKRLFDSIPSSVTSISFRFFRLNIITAVVSSLPNTIKELILDNCLIGDSRYGSHSDLIHLFSAIKPGVKKLSLRGNKLSELGEVFRCLHHGIEELDISDNKLTHTSGKNLGKLFASLPPALKILRFGSSTGEAGVVDYDKMITAFNAAPQTIQEFDFSRNGLINFKELSFVVAKLPQNIKSLDIFRILITEVMELNVSTPLICLPKHIDTLSFKSHNLALFSIDELVRLFRSTPKTVTAFDFSNTGLYQWPEYNLTTLFCIIPKHIKKLILKQNNLAYIDIHALKKALSSLAPSIVEIDLSENGFDRLPGDEFNARMDVIPDQVLCTLDKNQFFTRTNGALIALPFFNRAVSNKTERNEFPLHELIASSHHNQMIQARLDVVRDRITSVVPGANQIDLSRCELNLIGSLNLLESLLQTIPKSIVSINMRDNRFQADKQFTANLTVLLKRIPQGIVHIDLSDHGFEFLSAEKLRQLFIHLPATIQYVSLSPGKPISPAHQIAKREWPGSYIALTDQTPYVMQQARKLLDDYTKGNSGFLRFLSGHWNRTHVKEVAKIVCFIDKGLITSPNELLRELDRIEMSNEVGSLNKRLSFLKHKIAKHNELEAPHSDSHVALEQSSFGNYYS